MSTAARHPTATHESFESDRVEKDSELHIRVVRDMIERPDTYDDIPRGCLLVLVPDDDSEQAEWAIQQGAAGVRSGSNVYLRRIVVAELPPLPKPNSTATTGVKRTFYNQDGSICAVEVGRHDGMWIPAELSHGEPPLASADNSVEEAG